MSKKREEPTKKPCISNNPSIKGKYSNTIMKCSGRNGGAEKGGVVGRLRCPATTHAPFHTFNVENRA